jgi:hypothetical protein
VTPSKQEVVFNKVSEHLMTQKRKATGGNGCAYRGVDGTKCAIGCLIPDAIYSPSMEGYGVRGLLTLYPQLFELFGDPTLLKHLQFVHDLLPVEDWKGALSGLAIAHGISRPPCLE